MSTTHARRDGAAAFEAYARAIDAANLVCAPCPAEPVTPYPAGPLADAWAAGYADAEALDTLRGVANRSYVRRAQRPQLNDAQAELQVDRLIARRATTYQSRY